MPDSTAGERPSVDKSISCFKNPVAPWASFSFEKRHPSVERAAPGSSISPQPGETGSGPDRFRTARHAEVVHREEALIVGPARFRLETGAVGKRLELLDRILVGIFRVDRLARAERYDAAAHAHQLGALADEMHFDAAERR